MGGGTRIASVCLATCDRAGAANDPVDGLAGDSARALALALLAASPRVSMAHFGLCRVDARGWARHGGESALAELIRSVVEEAGFSGARVGIADSGVAADAAASLADGKPLIVPAGFARDFLAPLPLALLPISEELRATFRALGFQRVGEIASRARSELEARFGPEGVQAHRWACGLDEDGAFRPVASEELPEASVELDGSVTDLEPLLFVLRHLLSRLCADLAVQGNCAAALVLELELERGPPRRTKIIPARPTSLEHLLFDLCRAALEREFETRGLTAPVSLITLRVVRQAAAEARQGDLFAREPRDPLASSAAFTRLQARLGTESVVEPAPRADHRPETRNRWEPVDETGTRTRTVIREKASGEGGEGRAGYGGRDPRAEEALPPALRLLPQPRAVRVQAVEGRPAVVWDDLGRHEVAAAEGPERLSGDWWKAPYRREYYRVCTDQGELLWVFREQRGSEDPRWCLHGWWD